MSKTKIDLIDLIWSVKDGKEDEDADDETGEASEKYFREEITFQIFQFIHVHLNKFKVWTEKKWQKIVTNLTQKVWDRYQNRNPP